MTMTEGQIKNPLSLRRLTVLTLGAALVATVLSVTVVLPAEFGRDPTGVGTLLGLKDLGGGAATLATGSAARFYETGFRSDVVEIPLSAKGGGGASDLEYKVRMKDGATLIYSWEAEGADADGLFFDLHSETDGPDIHVVEFKQATASRSDGSLVAPVDGVHGWYWQNKSAKPIVVRLRIAGFYDLVPPGEAGNKEGILPKAVGAE
ncbi:MAG: hypothetical protein SGI91_06360 [Alphaproteobacteria bacterium]|jgi:hypothetical protein|nr:hypothetical protein [Alphaproteobacteria bacterium]